MAPIRSKSLIGPIHNWAASSGKLSLKLRHCQDDADREKQTCCRVTEHVGVEADRVSDRRNKEPNDDERSGEAYRERGRPPLVFGGRRAEDDWEDWQHAR